MNQIPKTISKSIDYLANIFSVSIKAPVYAKEDLAQDLYVYYLENKDTNKFKQFSENSKDFKNFWFISFKNYLISQYRRVIVEKKLLEKIKKEDICNR